MRETKRDRETETDGETETQRETEIERETERISLKSVESEGAIVTLLPGSQRLSSSDTATSSTDLGVFIYLFICLFVCLFIYGCVGSSFLCEGFL